MSQLIQFHFLQISIMKNFWYIVLLGFILQCFTTSVLAGQHGHQGTSIAHILAAGLIVQLLSKGHGGHGHGGHSSGRHAGGSFAGPAYANANSWLHETRMSPEATLASSAWAQRAPMDVTYSHSQYKEPLMESYNIPYYQQQPYTHPMSHGIW